MVIIGYHFHLINLIHKSYILRSCLKTQVIIQIYSTSGIQVVYVIERKQACLIDVTMLKNESLSLSLKNDY